MSTTELSTDPADYITGPTGGEAARTEGGTTRDGGVATFGSSRDGSEGGTPAVGTADEGDAGDQQ